MKNYVLVLGFLAGLVGGCTRPVVDATKISFTAPNQSLVALPVGKKACYGVNLSATDIPVTNATCGPALSQFSGFVEAGSSITLDVVRGAHRKIDAYIFLVNSGDSCPVWNADLIRDSSYLGRLFAAGSAMISTETDSSEVTIATTFPGENNSVALLTGVNVCNVSLKASLHTDGSVLDANGADLGLSHPINQGLISKSSAFDLGVISTGGMINFLSNDSIEVPAEVFSVTRKPDTGVLYGLLHSGQIVKVIPSGGTASYEVLSSATCPFSAPDCQVPVWMQSISAGYSKSLFGLDHSGQIHAISDLGLMVLGSVSPTVHQVSYY